MVTNSEAIQIKTGSFEYRPEKTNQFTLSLEYAKANNLKPVLLYNPDPKVNKLKDIEKFKELYPDFIVRATTDIPKNRHEVIMGFSSIIKFP